MNTKIALSSVSILASLAIMAGATFAFFSDTSTSTANTFASGTLTLDVDDSDQTATNTVTGSIVGSGMVPGGTSATGYVSLHNSGSTNIAEVEMGVVATETSDPGADSFLPDVLNLTIKTGDDTACTTGTVDHTSAIDAAVGNNSAPLTLSEFNGDTFDALPGVAALAADKFVCIGAQMDAAATNIYQGDAVSVDITFTANQDVTQ